MTYINPSGKVITVSDEYQVNITGDIQKAGEAATKNLQPGWFKKTDPYPMVIFYQLGGAMTLYFSNHPYAVRFTYYFEVRAKKDKERDKLAQDLCSALSKIYSARRGQYDDAIDGSDYLKRITFTFTVKLN